MDNLTALIQDTARKLLEDKKVDLVIGFAKGSMPLRSTPCFVRNAEDAGKLVWDRNCENNLANYLRKRNQKVAVVAKGCDARSIAVLLQENQVNRDNLYIIGVPCAGMIDRKKVETVLGGRELLATEEAGDSIALKGKGFTETVSLADLLHDSCIACKYPNPVICDVLLGEPAPGGVDKKDDFSDVTGFEAKSPSERKAEMADMFSRCIRCYACRNACPMCYCEECFVDCTTPQWIGKDADPEDNLLFQAVRVFHSAGRCADCGACERACPMDINLRLLTRKMVKDTKEMFGHEAGINLAELPALATFRPNDPETFLVKE